MKDTLLVSGTGHTATLGTLATIVENPDRPKFVAKICNAMLL